MSRIVIAGGSGFLGTALVAALDVAGHDVVMLTRNKNRKSKAKVVFWDAKTIGLGLWEVELDGADAVINLSGSSITEPWTDQNKKKMTDSRVESTKLIGEAIGMADNPPRVWINASAIGFYGSRREMVVDEWSSRGTGFLAELCVAWEKAVYATRLDATRCVELRIGMVLGPGGGAYAALAKAAKDMMGGPAGDGRQWVSWIHLYDLVRMIEWLLTADVKGPVNAVSPNPVRNEELMAALRKSFHRGWAPRVPPFALNIASKFGGPDPSILLDSIRAAPKLALEKGFEFEFPKIEEALADLRG